MRIALIADIHGNSVALDAVLADIAPAAVDLIVCLGDIAIGGPDPGGVVDRLAAAECSAVMGNADEAAIEVPEWWGDPAAAGAPEWAVPGIEVSAWGAERLAGDQRAWLAGLPATAEFDGLLAFHGSPRSSTDILAADTPGDELDEMLAGFDHAVLAGGHTHVPMVRRHGTRTIVNPGSVGMPFAEYGYAGQVPVLSHAAYGVVAAGAGIELRQVPVDEDALARSVAASGMPHGEWWLSLRGPAASAP